MLGLLAVLGLGLELGCRVDVRISVRFGFMLEFGLRLRLGFESWLKVNVRVVRIRVGVVLGVGLG